MAAGLAADAARPFHVTSEMVGFTCCCVLPLYVLGRLLYPMRSVRPRRPHTTVMRLPRRLFAASFSLSLSLLVLVLLDVVDGLSGASRSALWRLALSAHLTLLVVVLPAAQIMLLLRRATGASATAVAPLCVPPLLAWLYAFYRIGESFPVDSWRDHSGRDDDSALSSVGSFLGLVLHLCINRAGLIGVFLTAAMSGAGAVSAPAAALARKLRPVAQMEMRCAERALLSSLHTLLQGNRRLAAVHERHEAMLAAAEAAAASAAPKGESGGRGERVTPGSDGARDDCGDAATGGAKEDEGVSGACLSVLEALMAAAGLVQARGSSLRSSSLLRAAKRDASALRADLGRRLRELGELDELAEAEAHARTRRGRAEDGLALLFFGYGVQKVALSTVSLLRRTHGRRANGLARAEPVLFRALGHAGALSGPTARAISLLVVGVLMVSSTRGFLRHVARLSVRLDALGAAGGSIPEGAPLGATGGLIPEGAPLGATGGLIPEGAPLGATGGLIPEGVPPPATLEPAPPPSSLPPPSFVDVVGCSTAHVMGFYLFSAVLLVRASLPWRYRGGIEEAVGGVEFSFYHHWFDTIFLSTACFTAGALVLRTSVTSRRRRFRAGSEDRGNFSCQRQLQAAMAARERAEKSERVEKSDAAGVARDGLPVEGGASALPAAPGSSLRQRRSIGSTRGEGGASAPLSAPGSILLQRRSVGSTRGEGPASALPAGSGSSLLQRRATPHQAPTTQGKSGAGEAAAHDGSTMTAASAAASRGPRALIDFVTSLNLDAQLVVVA